MKTKEFRRAKNEIQSLEALVIVPPAPGVTPWRAAPRFASRQALAGETMGTTWQAQWYDRAERSVDAIAAAIDHDLATVVRQMSHWLPTSHLSRLRATPAGQWTPLPPEFSHVLEFALGVAADTDGAYDPTVGALVASWGFGPEAAHSPPTDAMLNQGGWRRVTLADGQIRHEGDLSLDLSAIAKGFAVDQVARTLERLGVANYLVEIGGELRAAGTKADGEPWWVEIEPPGAVPFPSIRVALSGWAIATSGDYRQRRADGDQRWSHTIDPRTGRAVTNSIASVTVLHRECLAADAYSTALLVMGVREGLDFADTKDLAALIVERRPDGLLVHASRMLRHMI